MTAHAGIERLAGAVLCVGFPGATAAEVPLQQLADLGPGGVVLFGRNVTSLDATGALACAVREAIREKTGSPPFIAVDQEGGRVQRLRRGAHDVPSMMALGAGADVPLAERVGRLLGDDLRAAGIDVDFAPVMDLALQARSTVIGNRAFGDDPTRTAELGVALMSGLQSTGVAATLKHFPGHGATPDDTHETLPHIDADLGTLRSRELLPFESAIEAGARAVMSAHVIFSALDATAPATLSRRILHDLLRKELGFCGVCFTDCLEMGAVASWADVPQVAVRALIAGADVVLVSQNLAVGERVRAAIVEAVKNGDIPMTQLERSAQRARTLMCLDGRPKPSEDGQVAREAARRAITLIRAATPPGASIDGPVTVVSFEPAETAAAEDDDRERGSLHRSLQRRGVRAELLRVPSSPDPGMVEQLVAVVAQRSTPQVIVILRRAHLYGAQRDAVTRIIGVASETVLVSALEPFDVPLFPQARTVVCTYGDDGVTMDALADVLTGRARATGRLPVHL